MLIKQHNKIFDLKTPASLKLIYVEGKGLGLFANRNFKSGEAVISFANTFVSKSEASFEAVQVTDKKYLDTKWLVPEAFVNHNCNPNTRFDFQPDQKTSCYRAIKAIKRNEEITFNYNTTDWDSKKEPFACNCGSKNCYRLVQGLKYLNKQQRNKLKPFILPYLLKKLKL
ncbi:MAG: SET domain-containing methyltransferase [Candidatus Liptonbacteria bacterium]|nr:SET domain-containing methyltransferase [Candidatus Liptonbacteria bacterium]